MLNIFVNTKINIPNTTKFIIENPSKRDDWKIIVPILEKDKITRTFAKLSIGFNKTIFPEFSVFVFSINEYDMAKTIMENIIRPIIEFLEVLKFGRGLKTILKTVLIRLPLSGILLLIKDAIDLS